MSGETWGPWIEHTGTRRDAPVGYFVMAIGSKGSISKDMVCASVLAPPPGFHTAWDVAESREADNEYIKRYRIRKPGALQHLEQIACGARPVNTPEREDA